MKSTKNQGFSLIEVIVAMAIGAVFALGLATVISNMSKGNLNVRQAAEALEMTNQIAGILGNPANCQANMFSGVWGPVNFPPATRNGGNPISISNTTTATVYPQAGSTVPIVACNTSINSLGVCQAPGSYQTVFGVGTGAGGVPLQPTGYSVYISQWYFSAPYVANGLAVVSLNLVFKGLASGNNSSLGSPSFTRQIAMQLQVTAGGTGWQVTGSCSASGTSQSLWTYYNNNPGSSAIVPTTLNVGVGSAWSTASATAPAYPLDVLGQANVSGPLTLGPSGGAPVITATAGATPSFQVGTGAQPTVLFSSSISAQVFNYYSDRSLKRDIRDAEGLELIERLRGRSFYWKNTGDHDYGVIAQEVEEVLPELVKERNGIKSVKYGSLIGPLIEAVKEQQREIESLRKEVGELRDSQSSCR